MKFNIKKLHGWVRLLAAVFVLAVLVAGNFCFSSTTSLAHNENVEVISELSFLGDQTDKECCHGTFHNENHEPAKIAVGNQQINNQAGIVSASTALYFSNLSSGNIGYFEYSKNVEEDANPPNSILLC